MCGEVDTRLIGADYLVGPAVSGQAGASKLSSRRHEIVWRKRLVNISEIIKLPVIPTDPSILVADIID